MEAEMMYSKLNYVETSNQYKMCTTTTEMPTPVRASA